jgi:hypothetical protein
VGGRHLNHPDLPAILLASADTPDTALGLTCTGQDAALSQWDIEFAYRATGVTPNPVNTMADNVFTHFRSMLGVKAANVVWQAGSIVDMPSLILPGLLEWTGAERTTRGTTEATSPAKHNGTRFVPRDVWRVTMFPEVLLHSMIDDASQETMRGAWMSHYGDPQGMSTRQLRNANRRPTHQRGHDRAYDRVRNTRPARRERANAAYQAIPKPIGLRCALRIEHVCTGWATTWDAKVPYANGGRHVPSNLQPTCRECNSSKGAR